MTIYPSRPQGLAHCRECGHKLPAGVETFTIIERYYNTDKYNKCYVCKECLYYFLAHWELDYCSEYWEVTEDRMEVDYKRIRARKYANPDHALMSKLSYHRSKGHTEKVHEILEQLLPYEDMYNIRNKENCAKSGKYANPKPELITQLAEAKKQGNDEKAADILRQLLPFSVEK